MTEKSNYRLSIDVSLYLTIKGAASEEDARAAAAELINRRFPVSGSWLDEGVSIDTRPDSRETPNDMRLYFHSHTGEPVRPEEFGLEDIREHL